MLSIRTLSLIVMASALTAVEGRSQVGDLTFDASLGVDLATMTRSPTGLYSKVLVEGRGEPAVIGAQLRVEFTAYLPNGSQFSTTPPDEPMEFVLDGGSMIPGFSEGVIGIRPGESRLLVVPPDLAYGDRGVTDIVPPGATLVFRVRRVDGMLPPPYSR